MDIAEMNKSVVYTWECSNCGERHEFDDKPDNGTEVICNECDKLFKIKFVKY